MGIQVVSNFCHYPVSILLLPMTILLLNSCVYKVEISIELIFGDRISKSEESYIFQVDRYHQIILQKS